MEPARIAQMADNDVAALAKAGDIDAWDELIRRYYDPLRRYLGAKTGNAEDAVDLTQQTFLAAWLQIGRWTSTRPFAAWLYWVAWYTFLPWRRRRRQARQASLEFLEERAGGALHAAPDDIATWDEREAIQAIFDGLSPKLREALLLHEVQGLSSREIALVLGISAAAAGQRVGRGLVQFRTRYAASAELMAR